MNDKPDPRPSPAASPPSISRGKAAKALGVSTRTLERWALNGKLVPAGRSAGGHARYTEDQIVAAQGLKFQRLHRRPRKPPEPEYLVGRRITILAKIRVIGRDLERQKAAGIAPPRKPWGRR